MKTVLFLANKTASVFTCYPQELDVARCRVPYGKYFKGFLYFISNMKI